jgi:hypothetical protein
MTKQRVQIVVGVPPEHVGAVLDAISSAGGGIIGNYTHCAFTSGGEGRFKPNAAANPHVGEKQTINAVPETRIETFCERDYTGREDARDVV